MRLIVILSILFLFTGCFHKDRSDRSGSPISDANAGETTFTTSLSLTVREAEDSTGVGSVSCNSDETVTGGGCRCTGSRSEGQNYGILFSCHPSGNGYLGACYDHLFDSELNNSPIVVKAVCAKTSMNSESASSKVGAENDTIESQLTILREQVRQQRDLQLGFE